MSDWYRLSYWEEAVGVLNQLTHEDDFLLARIGRVVLILPLELEEKLQGYIGTRIGLLRSDSNVQPYLIRVISNQITDRIVTSTDSAERVGIDGGGPGNGR